MEIWLTLLIPFIITLYCIIKYKRKLVWWEIPIPITACIFIVVLFNWWGKNSLTNDYEYWGNYVTEVRYYEDWDEWISQTCTRSYPCGTDADGNTTYCTEVYDCSYRKYHNEYWAIILNDNSKIKVSKKYYQELKRKFGTSDIFVNMNRNYYRKDGDMYKNIYPNTYESFEFFVRKKHYKNKVKPSHDVFNYPEVTDEEKEQFNLYEYPEIVDNKLPTVLSRNLVHDSIQKKFDWLNGKLGMNYQIRVWVLLFDNLPRETGLMQEAYWVNGNKNELVICIGLNDDDILWSHIFSWTESQIIKIELRNFIEISKTLNLSDICDFTYEQIEKNWVRKEFADFEYLEVQLPRWAMISTIIFTTLMSIILSVYIIKNEYN